MNGRDGSEVAGEEPTQVLVPPEQEEWPVTDLYRVAPEADAPPDEAAVVVSSPPAAPPAPRRRLPVVGAGVGVAILLATLGIALGSWLLSRESNESAASTVTTPASETGPVTPPPTPQPPASQQEEIPDVVGLRVASARALLEDAGFEVRVTRQSSDRPPGEVLAQKPAAGGPLEPGETVTLTVARQARPVVVQVDVPDVLSLPVGEASAQLRRAQLRPQIELVPSSKDPGTVVEQEPRAGAEVSEGTLVVLSVARSQPPEVSRVDVPDVVGSTVADARRTLRARGFRVSIARVLDDAPAGTVVGQTPPAGSSAREGATIRLRVSTGPRAVIVPDVVGMDEITARAELEAAGFVVRVSEEPTDDPANDGVVLRQSPSGGSSSDEGAVVTLVIGRFD